MQIDTHQKARFEKLIVNAAALFGTISEEAFSRKEYADKWSKKEILGHLIDSAANNHHRFVRSQFQDIPVITYNQNDWVSGSSYQHQDLSQLIAIWTVYNRFLIGLVSRISSENMERLCNTGSAENISLYVLWEDYVAHLLHHLEQITGEKMHF